VSATSSCQHGRRRPRLELADLVRTHGDDLRQCRRLTGEQLVALRAIERCRTPALGGQREQCMECGAERILWRSCRNRHCPKCQTVAKERWLASRLDELLPVPYLHIVFTVPHALNGLALQRPRLVYTLLFRAAAETLHTFAHDPQYLGAEPGIIAVLHTWGQNLALHIHLHCIVTSGGMDPTYQRWIRRGRRFVFPVRAMSRVFRGTYLQALRRTMRDERVAAPNVDLAALWHHDWVVYAKAPFDGPRRVLDYLARYTHRVALTNDRLLGLRDGTVRLRWRDYARGGKHKVLRLHPVDLLGRFIQHVLPRGFRRIRHYGLLGNRHKAVKLAACLRYFGLEPRPASVVGSAVTERILRRMGIDPNRCPTCGSTRLVRQLLSPITLPWARAPTGPRSPRSEVGS
jgi:hypothetical protein